MERKKVEMLRIKDVQMFQACKIDVRLNFKAGLLLGCLDDVDHLVMGGFVAFF